MVPGTFIRAAERSAGHPAAPAASDPGQSPSPRLPGQDRQPLPCLYAPRTRPPNPHPRDTGEKPIPEAVQYQTNWINEKFLSRIFGYNQFYQKHKNPLAFEMFTFEVKAFCKHKCPRTWLCCFAKAQTWDARIMRTVSSRETLEQCVLQATGHGHYSVASSCPSLPTVRCALPGAEKYAQHTGNPPCHPRIFILIR